MTALSIRNLSVPLGGRAVLEDIGFEAQGGIVLGLIGPNGAGKSTLARAIAGLLAPNAGTITVGGVPLATMDRRDIARSIAYLPQGDTVHWALAARATVSLGRAPHLGRFGLRSATDEAAIDHAMARADLGPMADRDVRSLSGGERARVLLARALAVEAPILVADEPVGALDPRHALRIMGLLREEAERGALVIAVLHDLALASRFCDRLIVLNEGRLVGDGPPLDVLSPPGLARHYRVSGHHGAYDAENFVIPWRVIEHASHHIEGDMA